MSAEPGITAAVDQELAHNGEVLDDIISRVRTALGSRSVEQVSADLAVTLPATYDHGDVSVIAAMAIVRLAKGGAA